MSGHPACQNARKALNPEPGKHWPGEDVKDLSCPQRDREDVIRMLDCWVDNIEDDCALKKRNPDPCTGCLPEFTCFGAYPFKRPFCNSRNESPLITNIQTMETRFVSEKKNVADTDPRVTFHLVGYNKEETPIPVWERPRIHSQMLIAGHFNKVTDCFKRNGLDDLHFCPRSKSCKIFKSMFDWIESDKRDHGGNKYIQPEKIECCCCPGEPNRHPHFKCVSCEPPDQQSSPRLSHKIEHKQCPGKQGHHQHVEAHHDQRPNPNNWANCFGKNMRRSEELWPDPTGGIVIH